MKYLDRKKLFADMRVQIFYMWPAVLLNVYGTSFLRLLLPGPRGTHVLVKDVGLWSVFRKIKVQSQRLDEGRAALPSGDWAVQKGSLTSPGLLC